MGKASFSWIVLHQLDQLLREEKEKQDNQALDDVVPFPTCRNDALSEVASAETTKQTKQNKNQWN